MHRPRTRNALFLSLGLAAALPAATLGTWRVTQLRHLNRVETDKEVEAAAVTLAHDISRELSDHVRVAETLAEQISSLGSMADVAELQRLVAVERRHLAEAPVILVGNSHGFSIACDPPLDEAGKPNAGRDYSDRDYFREMVASGKTAISRVQIGRVTRRPNIQIAAPIHDAAGKLTGYVLVSIDPALFQAEADQIRMRDATLRVIVLDRTDRVLVHPDAAARAQIRDLHEVAAFARGGSDGVVLRSGAGDSGVAERVAVASIGNSDWRVIVGRTWEEIDRDARTARNIFIAVTLGTVLIGLAVALALSSALARPLTDLAQDVERIRGGDRDHEIGRGRFVTNEVEVLTVALSDLIAEVRAHETHLEAAVADRTARLETARADTAARLEELKAAQSKLVESGRLAAIGQLAAGVAHEINNPASYVLSNLAFIQKSLLAPSRDSEPEIEDLRIAAQDALDGAQRIREIVKDVRVVSRPDDGKQTLFDLSAAVRSAIRICRGETLHRADVKLEIQEGFVLKGSASALSQIFVNLVVNAAQAMPAGKRGVISVSTRREGGSVCVSVVDDGAGIVPEHLARIFEPFFTTKPAGEGVGLGLSIARETVRRHGGELTAASTPGVGTRIEIRLPLVEEGAPLSVLLSDRATRSC